MGSGRFDGKGFAVGSVFGVRWWDLKPDGALVGMRAAWQPGENTAACGAMRGHEVPDESCGCGFWAYWRPEQHAGIADRDGGRPVVGVVEGYGSVIVGERGFRAARARIVAVCPQFVAMMRDPSHVPPAEPSAERLALHRHHAARMADRIFRRGPAGVGTFHALGGGEIHDPPVPLVEDLATQARVEMELAERYVCELYSSLPLMLVRHPPTADYLPHPDKCACSQCLQPFIDQMAELVKSIQGGLVSPGRAADELRQLTAALAMEQAAADAARSNVPAAHGYMLHRYGGANWGHAAGGSGGSGSYSGGSGAGGGGGGGSAFGGRGGPLAIGGGGSAGWTVPRGCCATMAGYPHDPACPTLGNPAGLAQAMNLCPYCLGAADQGTHSVDGCVVPGPLSR